MTKAFRTFGTTRDERTTSEIEVFDKYDIDLVRGNTITYVITLQTIDDNGKQGYYDLTDHIIYFTVRKEPNIDPPVIEKDSAHSADIEITDAVNGEFELTVQRADTIDLDPNTYFHDIQIVSALGETYTPIMGRLNLIRNITALP
jgi:hypothetical protein